jgi:dipeptidyl aminopeptidase/acylaminoacyl peptidase
MKRHPFGPDDLWALPRVGAPSPSPDGTKVIVPVTTFAMAKNEGTTQLWLVDVKSGGRRVLTTAEASSGQANWSPDGRRIAFVRKHRDQPQVHILPLDGGEAERVTDLPLGAVDPKWFPDGKRLALLVPLYRDALTIAATEKAKKAREESPVKARVTEERYYRFWDRWIEAGPVHHLFVLDLETKSLTDLIPRSIRLWEPNDPTGHYDIAPDGREIVFDAKRTAPSDARWIWGAFRVGVENRGEPQLLMPDHPAGTERPRYSPDGRLIVLGLTRLIDFYADKVRLVAIDRRTSRATVLTEAWEHSAHGWEFVGPKLVFAADVAARSAFFEIGLKPATPRLIVRDAHLGEPQPAGGALFAMRSSLCEPPEVVVVRGGRVRRLTDFTAPVMKRVALGAIEEDFVEGAGGDRVQMYLVKPSGWKKGRRLPLVHMIHGGPHGVFGDEWHWRWNAQAFAAPGYVVALVNFHGSTSWGQEFARCIQGRWGDQPYDDVMAATDRLIARGLVDSKRMAATGGSYGGYLSAWLAAKTPRFACIVNHAGVSDLQTQWGTDVTQGDEIALGGSPWENREGLDRFNPMRRAEGFQSPMLILHGEKDYRVPYGNALEMYNVYKAMGKRARLVVYPDENHWILKPQNSKHWYGEVLGWLKRWLK